MFYTFSTLHDFCHLSLLSTVITYYFFTFVAFFHLSILTFYISYYFSVDVHPYNHFLFIFICFNFIYIFTWFIVFWFTMFIPAIIIIFTVSFNLFSACCYMYFMLIFLCFIRSFLRWKFSPQNLQVISFTVGLLSLVSGLWENQQDFALKWQIPLAKYLHGFAMSWCLSLLWFMRSLLFSYICSQNSHWRLYFYFVSWCHAQHPYDSWDLFQKWNGQQKFNN